MSTEPSQLPAVIPPAQSAATLLNLRQKSFVDNYLVCRVKWKAAQLAGYSGDPNALGATANEILRNPKVQAYYNECLEAMACSPKEVLAEIGEIARAPWKDFVEVKYGEEGEVLQANLKLSEKLKALELAGKSHRLFVDKIETDTPDPRATAEEFVKLIAEAAERMRAGAIETRVIDVTPTGSGVKDG